MFMDILKNPIIIGIFFGIITYIYMKYKNDEKYKKNPKLKQPPNILIPVTVTFITGFITWSYFGSGKQPTVNTIPLNNNMIIEQHDISWKEHEPKVQFSNHVDFNDTVSDGSQSFQLISKGIHPPTGLPDMFLDIETF